MPATKEGLAFPLCDNLFLQDVTVPGRLSKSPEHQLPCWSFSPQSEIMTCLEKALPRVVAVYGRNHSFRHRGKCVPRQKHRIFFNSIKTDRVVAAPAKPDLHL